MIKTILFFIALSSIASAQPFAFLFENGTYAISSDPFEYSERIARLQQFTIVTQETQVVHEKSQWAQQAEALFAQGMESNGFGTAPWTNQTFESVGIQLLITSINGETEESKNSAARWKGVLESVFRSLLDYHNSYRKQYGQDEISAIWQYPIGESWIYSNTLTRVGIDWDGKFFSPLP